MNLKEIAERFDGYEYRTDELSDRLSSDEHEWWIVIVSWASDDIVSFDWAISDEAGAYEWWTVYITKDWRLFDENSCDDEECPYKEKAREDCFKINIQWDNEWYSWTYTTDIPHETFDIMEDWEKYCRGIVFNINNLK